MGRWDGGVCEGVGREIRSGESRLLVLLCACTHLHTQAYAHALAKHSKNNAVFKKSNSEVEGSYMTVDIILSTLSCPRKLTRGIN